MYGILLVSSGHRLIILGRSENVTSAYAEYKQTDIKHNLFPSSWHFPRFWLLEISSRQKTCQHSLQNDLASSKIQSRFSCRIITSLLRLNQYSICVLYGSWSTSTQQVPTYYRHYATKSIIKVAKCSLRTLFPTNCS